MSPLAWLRAQRRKPKYATGGFVPGPVSDEASIVPVGFKVPMPGAPRLGIESGDLEEGARRLRDAIAESGITVRRNPKPDECLCCIGRYSTCRNPNR